MSDGDGEGRSLHRVVVGARGDGKPCGIADNGTAHPPHCQGAGYWKDMAWRVLTAAHEASGVGDTICLCESECKPVVIEAVAAALCELFGSQGSPAP